MATASDSFNRANETPLVGNWTSFGGAGSAGWNLSGNIVVPSDTSQDELAMWNANSFGADQFSEGALTEASTSSGTGPGFFLRGTGTVYASWTGYRMAVNKGTTLTVEIGRTNSGSFSSLATFNVASWTSGDIWRYEIAGFVLKVYRNGSLVGSFDDSASGSKIASGQLGLFYSSTGSTPSIDNWNGGDLGGRIFVPRRMPLGV